LRERIPVYMSAGTYAAIGEPDFHGMLRIACDGETIAIGSLQVRPFTVPHDAREPLQLTCTDGDTRLGVLTDLGHASAHVQQQLAGCATLLLECNHDEDMLSASTYPPFLKRRVAGAYGHLANSKAAALAQSLLPTGLRQVLAAHLSEQNNKPELARQALAQALSCGADDIHVADGAVGSGWLTA
jgi:phosphoribosyl 1,2-cyclic phosphodiesterase